MTAERTAERTALVTVSDDRFVPGTLVMASSFLRHNPWFTGDIYVIHEGLSQEGRGRLARVPRVRTRPVSPRLRARLDALIAARPSLEPRRRVLFSIDAFGFDDYDLVVKVDSDVLCAGSATELVTARGALLACPDRFFFMDKRRDRVTYLPSDPGTPEPGSTFPPTFNPGVMAIRPGALAPSTFDDLLAALKPESWDGVRTGHADSVILNRHFEGRWTQVSERYNYMIWKEPDRYSRPRVPLDEAVFLHFLPRPKPWETPERGAGPEERDRALAMWDAAAARLTTRDTD